ncbi:hypothetical protein JOF35_007538 [Streptomyces demainii]|uniref:Uncharacterized protein n=1 Tax=Streptomyces demainii TaxID=588122 RepID=A0ABT9L4F0_9ACTN|nr:hypothetical protein [Streptomyces demainii]
MSVITQKWARICGAPKGYGAGETRTSGMTLLGSWSRALGCEEAEGYADDDLNSPTAMPVT